jgi:hypothetical protein
MGPGAHESRGGYQGRLSVDEMKLSTGVLTDDVKERGSSARPAGEPGSSEPSPRERESRIAPRATSLL